MYFHIRCEKGHVPRTQFLQMAWLTSTYIRMCINTCNENKVSLLSTIKETTVYIRTYVKMLCGSTYVRRYVFIKLGMDVQSFVFYILYTYINTYTFLTEAL